MNNDHYPIHIKILNLANMVNIVASLQGQLEPFNSP